MNNIIQILKYKPLLETLIANPDKGYSIRSLAKLSGISYATTWRVIKSLEKSGLLRTRKVGAVCLVFPDRSSNVWDDLIRVMDIGTDPLMASLKKEFEFISRDAKGLLLYGSHAQGIADERSDIDICIIKPRNRKLIDIIYAKVGGKYDIKIFEDMPLFLKMDVIGNYMVIFGSEPDISYYFYRFRKMEQDMRNRMLANRFRSAREMIQARRRWLDAKR